MEVKNLHRQNLQWLFLLILAHVTHGGLLRLRRSADGGGHSHTHSHAHSHAPPPSVAHAQRRHSFTPSSAQDRPLAGLTDSQLMSYLYYINGQANVIPNPHSRSSGEPVVDPLQELMDILRNKEKTLLPTLPISEPHRDLFDPRSFQGSNQDLHQMAPLASHSSDPVFHAMESANEIGPSLDSAEGGPEGYAEQFSYGQTSGQSGYGKTTTEAPGYGQTTTKKSGYGQSAEGYEQTTLSDGYERTTTEKPVYGQTTTRQRKPSGYGYRVTTKDGYDKTTKSAGYRQSTPISGYGQTTTKGYGQTTESGYGQTTEKGYGQTTESGYGQTTERGYGQTTVSGYGHTTTVWTTTPKSGYKSAGYEEKTTPSATYETPNNQYQAPKTQYNIPETEYGAPKTEYKNPKTESEAPEAAYKAPDNEYRAPDNEYKAPDNEYKAPDNEYNAPKTEYEAPDTEYKEPEMEYKSRPAENQYGVLNRQEIGEGGSEELDLRTSSKIPMNKEESEDDQHYLIFYLPDGRTHHLPLGLNPFPLTVTNYDGFSKIRQGAQVEIEKIEEYPSDEDKDDESKGYGEGIQNDKENIPPPVQAIVEEMMKILQSPATYEAPDEEYGAPDEMIKKPEGYRAPQSEYAAPEKEYEAPEKEYEAPEKEYEAPEKEYGAPKKEYEAPEKEYGAPKKEYEAPEKEYGAPEKEAMREILEEMVKTLEEYRPPQLEYGTPEYKGIDVTREVVGLDELEHQNVPAATYGAPRPLYGSPTEKQQAPVYGTPEYKGSAIARELVEQMLEKLEGYNEPEYEPPEQVYETPKVSYGTPEETRKLMEKMVMKLIEENPGRMKFMKPISQTKYEPKPKDLKVGNPKTGYDIPFVTPPSYITTSSTGYSKPPNNYEAPKEEYETPKSSYGTPQLEYNAPKREYDAPKQEYDVPKQEYDSPKQEYDTPKKEYEVPKQEYESPKPSYETPQLEYDASEEEYEASEPNYETPKLEYRTPKNEDRKPKYDVPQSQYGTPVSKYGLPETTEQKRTTPGLGYTTPIKSYGLPEQSTYQRPRQQYQAPPLLTYNIGDVQSESSRGNEKRELPQLQSGYNSATPWEGLAIVENPSDTKLTDSQNGPHPEISVQTLEPEFRLFHVKPLGGYRNWWDRVGVQYPCLPSSC